MGRWAIVLMFSLAPTGWSPPVEGPAVRLFERPVEEWSPGHRGVDYSVPPGTPVRAVAGGQVVFAGRVAGGLHVTVAHPGGLRTSYSYLSRAAVAPGTAVVRGTLLGVSGGTGPGHAPGVVHLGVRSGGEYVDPGPLVGAAAPVTIRLAPLDGTIPPSVCAAR